MAKISKEKKQMVILAILGILMVIGCLYTYILAGQIERHGMLRQRSATLEAAINKSERLKKNARIYEEEVVERRKAIAERQQYMLDPGPPGQHYFWMLQLLQRFTQQQKIDVSFLQLVTNYGEVALLPEFFYKAAIFGGEGNGNYDDVGKFIAAFENFFPYMRIMSLRLQPELTGRIGAAPRDRSSKSSASAQEKLVFNIEVVTMIKKGTNKAE